ncbi:MAG: ATP-binding cassette domain-containing protein [bacterium]|nr:ATP-binding cassette domain-containing protein [bacterium]
MIQLVDVYKNLGGKQILNGASMDIEDGETRVILGRSGEGKSVCIKHICRLMQPDRGEVWVNGADISRLKESELGELRKTVGLLFQYAALFDSMNVLENVGFTLFERKVPVDEIRERVRETLKMVRLGDILDKMPSELSGGMKKRVGLARSIIQKPKILLYDEPTTGLDPVTSDAINDLIIHLAKQLKVTSVVITHDMVSAFKIATKISFLYQGRFIFTGTPEETRESDDPIIQQFIHGRSDGPLSNM